jgi:ATP-dependent Clp protease ATP-binding subunit ClpB
MRYDKFTTKFQQALSEAQSLAVGNDQQFIEPLVNLLNLTDKEASKRGDQFIASELFLLAAGGRQGRGRPPAEGERPASRKALEQAIDAVRGGENVDTQERRGPAPGPQAKYTLDLTERARQGKLDPVIGRDDEIRRAIQILQRRTKNNPVLIGEPGVGKTAIVEGLAQRIVNGEVPETLKGKRVLVLDMAGLLAGRQVPGRVRGAPEGRAQGHRQGRRPHHPVHRRAAHHGGRRQGRGRHRRRQHAQAGPGPRRAALHRRHHPGRVPQVHREGRRPGAPLPEGAGGRAQRGVHHRHPARPEGKYELHHGVDITDPAIVAAAELSTATSPTASCRTRPST